MIKNDILIMVCLHFVIPQILEKSRVVHVSCEYTVYNKTKTHVKTKTRNYDKRVVTVEYAGL